MQFILCCMPLNIKDMKLKLGAIYHVKSVTPIWQFRLAELVMSTTKTIPECEWLINGVRYPFNCWETDGVIWRQ